MVAPVCVGYLQSRVDSLRPFARLRSARVRRDKGWNVIEKTVVLVITQDENGLFPNLRILRENVENFAQVPRAKPRGAGVIRKSAGSDKPGNRGQPIRIDILSELVQHVALRYECRAGR